MTRGAALAARGCGQGSGSGDGNGPAGPGRGRGSLVYLVAPCVAALAVWSWHTPGRFVAAGDIGPFFHNRLAADIGGLWGYGLTGTGSATVEIARLPEAVIATAAGWAGLAPELAQLGWFWLWLTGASAACIALARQLGAGSPAAAVVGALAVVNPLFALNLPNVLVAAAVCCLALIATALVRAGRGSGRVRGTVLATLPVSYLAVNPPTLFVVGAAVAVGTGAALAFLPRARAPLARHLALVAPLALVANLWWIVPAWVLYLGAGGPYQAAVTDPAAWAWAHANNSLPNVATLTAHWGWGLEAIVPFSERLDDLPWSPLRWALPALALAACVLASTRALRRTAFVALGGALGLIVIGKGLHPPAPWLNAWLYEHVPGMWLLREPVSKVGPVLLLCYLVGAAIAVDGAIARLRATTPPGAVLGSAGLATLVAGAVLFGHPVVTGGVAPTDRTPLPPARVAVPAGWGDLADALNADPVAGKALVLPTQPFYQATTNWGFHGVATLPRDLLDRPTLLALPGGYFSYPPVAGALVDVVSTTTDRAHLARVLDALGVSHVIVRTDLAELQPVLPVAGPEPLLERLAQSGLFDAPVDYGVATVLRRALAHGGAQVFAEGARVLAAGPAGTARAVASLPPTAAAVDAGVGVDMATSVFDTDEESVETALRVPAAGRYLLSAVPQRGLTAAVRPSGDGVVVDPGLEIRLGGEVLGRSAVIHVPSPHPGAQVVAVSVDGAPTLFDEGPVGVRVADGASLSSFAPAGDPQQLTAWSEVMNCNPLDGRDAGLGAAVEGGSVELWARRHAACVAAAVPVSGRALLSFESQVAEGPAARACLWSPSAGRCVWERVVTADASAWVAIRDVVDVPTDALLHLYADAPSGPARTRYRDITAVALAEGPAVTARLDLAVEGVELGAGEHAVVLARPAPQQFGTTRVGEVSAVGNCHARTPGAVVSATVAGEVVRLKADHDAACVSFPIERMTPGVTYEVVLEYRTRTPPAGRWCLWLDGPDRCANKTAALAHSPVWAVHRDRVTLPQGVSGARLYVYADADPARRGALTVNEYRRPTVRPETPVTVTLRGEGGRGEERAAGTTAPRPRAVLRSATAAPDRWQLTVVGAGHPFLVALPDAHDAGWALAGLPAGASAVPTTVDGYRQAWAVSGLTGEATLTAYYALAMSAIAARWASLVAVAAAVLPWPWLLGLLRSPRRRTRTPLD